MKTLLQSRTFLIALLQAVAGVAIIATTELGYVGVAVIIKSIVDILLRLDTTTEITSIR